MGRFAAALSLTIALVIGAAVVLAAYLNYSSVRASYLSLLDTRLDAIGERIGSDIETALSFGLPLDGQTTLTALLARERGTDPTLLAIDVVDDRGHVLFSSEPDRVSEAAQREAATDGGSVRTRPITTDFGAVVGNVEVYAADAEIQRQLDAVRSEVIGSALAGGGIAFAIAVAGLALLLRRLRHQAEEVSAYADSGAGSGPLLHVPRHVEREHDELATALAGGGAGASPRQGRD